MDRGRFLAGRRGAGGGRRRMSKQLGRQQRPRGGSVGPSFNGREAVDGLAHSCSSRTFHGHEVGLRASARASRLISSTSARSSSVHGFVVGGCCAGRGPVRLRVAARAADLLADLSSRAALLLTCRGRGPRPRAISYVCAATGPQRGDSPRGLLHCLHFYGRSGAATAPLATDAIGTSA